MRKEIIKIGTQDIEPILLNHYSLNENKKRNLIFVGGSDDDRTKFENIVNQLLINGVFSDIFTISFRGTESERKGEVMDEIQELEEILEHLIKNNKVDKAEIVCTSAGAISTTSLIANDKYSSKIDNAVYLDPADYRKVEGKYKSWSGFANFNESETLVSNKLTEINSDTKVHVVNFMLKNHSPDGYAPEAERDKNNPNLFKRLNYDMVKAFWNNTPDKNKGKYIEDEILPHAFMRDGDVAKNEKRVVELITETIDS